MDICNVCDFLHKILKAYVTYPCAKDICVKIWKSLEKLIFSISNNWQKDVKIKNTQILLGWFLQ